MKTTVTPAQSTRKVGAPLALLGTAFIAVGLAAAAVGLVIAGGSYVVPPAGLPDPGPLVVWGVPVLRVLTDAAAVLTVGLLLAAVALDPSGRDGVLSPVGRKDILRAAWAAGAWAVLAMAQLFFLLADVLALPLTEAIRPEVVSTYANELPTTRALLVMAILALVIAAAVLTSATTGAAVVWLVMAVIAASLPALAGHTSSLGDHELATTAGVTHVVAAVLWIGGLIALGVHAFRGDMPMKRAVQRFSPIALTSIILLAISGVANSYTRLDSLDQIVTTGYGQVTMMKVFIIIALAALGYIMRGRIIAGLDHISGRMAFARVAGIELTIMMIAVGLGVALATSPYPRTEQDLPTYGETLLGFPYPAPPTPEGVIFGGRIDPLFLSLSLIAAALYVIGYVRLRSRGDSWPIMRLVSWLLGISVVIWSTNAGISVYSQVSVGLHMLQHMILTMMGPILLVLGAPATLALRALKPSHTGERGPREWLIWFLHSPITRVLTNPFYVFFVYVIGLYALYLTPLFGWLMGSHVGHVLMQTHFVVSGYLFYWVLIGIDPRPKPLPYWGRLLMLLLALAVHAFFAVALMMGTTPMAVEWYGVVRPEWVTDPLQDTLLGGQIAWGVGEIPTLIVLIVIAVQWARSDERDAKRLDRQADRDGDAELAAYNEHLARLGRRSQTPSA